jgi:hypothetical protein
MGDIILIWNGAACVGVWFSPAAGMARSGTPTQPVACRCARRAREVSLAGSLALALFLGPTRVRLDVWSKSASATLLVLHKPHSPAKPKRLRYYFYIHSI